MEWKVSFCCCLIFIARVLLVFAFNVVVVALFMCSMASRLLFNMIMMIVDNFGCLRGEGLNCLCLLVL